MFQAGAPAGQAACATAVSALMAGKAQQHTSVGASHPAPPPLRQLGSLSAGGRLRWLPAGDSRRKVAQRIPALLQHTPRVQEGATGRPSRVVVQLQLASAVAVQCGEVPHSY